MQTHLCASQGITCFQSTKSGFKIIYISALAQSHTDSDQVNAHHLQYNALPGH